jgi:hypothetical protein
VRLGVLKTKKVGIAVLPGERLAMRSPRGGSAAGGEKLPAIEKILR